METKKQVRIDYIDIFRGFGIMLMLMGHVGYVKWFDHFFHAFHMPMFFCVSGMFFNLKTWNIRKKIKSLLVPYAFLQLFIISCG